MRRPADSTNVRAIYPNGFQPQINPHVTGRLTSPMASRAKPRMVGTWKWDLSETYGLNNLYYYTINSVNVTYGAASPTRFYDGELSFRQADGNLDLSRE